MVLELADGHSKRKKVFVQGYDRHANYVPSYSRRRPLNDSSLFSFKLADGGPIGPIGGGAIVNANAFLVVPDPANIKAPRRVRVDMFDALPDSEFMKVISYVQNFNAPEAIDEAVQYRLCSTCSTLGDEAVSAFTTVESVFQTPANGTTVQDSFWDKEFIPGIKNKYSLPIAGFITYKFLF